MTTLVALSTKDALVMGCDSLASVTRPFISPNSLYEFFEPSGDWPLKIGADGKPLLKDFGQIYGRSQMIPYSHMTHVSKLFSLAPLPCGVMATGIASIGQRTIKSIITEFKSSDNAFSQNVNYTVNSLGSRLLEFLRVKYCEVYPNERVRPELELIIGEYSKQSPLPSIFRIKVHENKIEPTINDFGIVFGGQMEEIQRIVFGTDTTNRVNMSNRCIVLLERYHSLLSQHFSREKTQLTIPAPIQYAKELAMFGDSWNLSGFTANWGDFSEQNAIECVDFFINIMIKSQQFSSRLPTVGGEVHIALITKQKFRFVSKEELSHAGHTIIWEEE